MKLTVNDAVHCRRYWAKKESDGWPDLNLEFTVYRLLPMADTLFHMYYLKNSHVTSPVRTWATSELEIQKKCSCPLLMVSVSLMLFFFFLTKMAFKNIYKSETGWDSWSFCQELVLCTQITFIATYRKQPCFCPKSAGGNDSATEKECIITILKN